MTFSVCSICRWMSGIVCAAPDQGLRLPHVHQRRHPAFLAELDELKRPLAQADVSAGDLELLVQRAKLEIGEPTSETRS